MPHIHHSRHAVHTEQVVQDTGLYAHVIFGPSELTIQADNIDKLAGPESTDTYPPAPPHGAAAER